MRLNRRNNTGEACGFSRRVILAGICDVDSLRRSTKLSRMATADVLPRGYSGTLLLSNYGISKGKSSGKLCINAPGKSETR